MKKLSLFLISAAALLLLWPSEGHAMMHGKGRHMRPYGDYCRGPRWGWYGAGHRVGSREETRKLVREYLGDSEYEIGEISDRTTYFEVEIVDSEGERADLLIVDKRTCRIRSAY